MSESTKVIVTKFYSHYLSKEKLWKIVNIKKRIYGRDVVIFHNKICRIINRVIVLALKIL